MFKKKNILLYLGIVLFSIILFNNFMFDYYTFDTYKVISLGYKDYALSTSLSEGRIFMGIIMLIFELLRIPINLTITITGILSILISSVIVIFMYKLMVKKDSTLYQKTLILLLNYFLIFNFMYIDNLRFLENFVMSLSLLFYTLAGMNLVTNKKVGKSFIFMFIGILFYQGTLNWFLMVVLFLSLINKNSYKEIGKNLFYSYIESFIAVVILYVYMKLYNALFNIQLNRFSNDIFENLRNLLFNLKIVIFNSSRLFPSFVFLAYTMLILFITLLYKDKNIKLNVISLILYSILVCIPILLISNVAIESTGRIFFSIGACISLLLLYLYNQENSRKILNYIFPIIVFSYSIISIYNIFVVTNCYKVGNEVDKQICMNVANYINQCQKDNIYIEKVAIKTSPRIDVNKILNINQENKPLRKLPISYIYVENKISSLLRYYNSISVQDTDFSENTEPETNNTFTYKIINNILYVSIK